MSTTLAAETVESHSKPFEDFDLRVDLDDDGNVWIVLLRSHDPKVTLKVQDLAEIVAFTETHGQVTVK